MAYVAPNHASAATPLMGEWVCTRVSKLGPYLKTSPPPLPTQHGPNFCGQCVSFVTVMCPTIPVATKAWKKGELVSEAKDILPGTAIATFNAAGHYEGHAAIFMSRTPAGINVLDQWISIPSKPIGPRLIRYHGNGVVNDASRFHIVD